MLANPNMGCNNIAKLNESFSFASSGIQDAVVNFVQALIQSENNK